MTLPVAPHVRRLIEVDMPLRDISRIARREKLNPHGSLSTLHIWWARRPPAACRAVLAATLWPDPCDSACPEAFIEEARRLLLQLTTESSADRSLAELLGSQWQRLRKLMTDQNPADDVARPTRLREALFSFIVAFAEPRAALNSRLIDIARRLTIAAHSSEVVTWDPFAGGGTIPVEALRLGSRVIAADLNPIPVMLNRIVLEALPKHRSALTDAFSGAAHSVGAQLAAKLRHLYPTHDGSTPLVYLWARQIRCEGPACGLLFPLIRNLQLTRDGARWYYEVCVKNGLVDVSIKRDGMPQSKPTVAGGAATCPNPACGFTTPPGAVRTQLSAQHGGAADARLLAVCIDGPEGRTFVEPTDVDRGATVRAAEMLDRTDLPMDSINPTRPYKNTRGLSAVTRIGIETFADLYTPRQALVLQHLRQLIAEVNHPEWDSGRCPNSC